MNKKWFSSGQSMVWFGDTKSKETSPKPARKKKKKVNPYIGESNTLILCSSSAVLALRR